MSYSNASSFLKIANILTMMMPMFWCLTGNYVHHLTLACKQGLVGNLDGLKLKLKFRPDQSVLCFQSPLFHSSYVPQILWFQIPIFPGSNVPRILCFQGLMFPISYVTGVLRSQHPYSLVFMFPGSSVPNSHIPRDLYFEVPMLQKSHFPSSYIDRVPMFQCFQCPMFPIWCSQHPIFPNWYVPRALCS